MALTIDDQGSRLDQLLAQLRAVRPSSGPANPDPYTGAREQLQARTNQLTTPVAVGGAARSGDFINQVNNQYAQQRLTTLEGLQATNMLEMSEDPQYAGLSADDLFSAASSRTMDQLAEMDALESEESGRGLLGNVGNFLGNTVISGDSWRRLAPGGESAGLKDWLWAAADVAGTASGVGLIGKTAGKVALKGAIRQGGEKATKQAAKQLSKEGSESAAKLVRDTAARTGSGGDSRIGRLLFDTGATRETGARAATGARVANPIAARGETAARLAGSQSGRTVNTALGRNRLGRLALTTNVGARIPRATAPSELDQLRARARAGSDALGNFSPFSSGAGASGPYVQEQGGQFYLLGGGGGGGRGGGGGVQLTRDQAGELYGGYYQSDGTWVSLS